MDQIRWNTHPPDVAMRQFFCFALGLRCHVLERCHPATGECNYLGGVGNTGRNVRIIEWIVEGISKVTPWRPRSVRWIIRRVVNVEPGLGWATAHVAQNLSIRRTPRQPDGGS